MTYDAFRGLDYVVEWNSPDDPNNREYRAMAAFDSRVFAEKFARERTKMFKGSDLAFRVLGRDPDGNWSVVVFPASRRRSA